MFDARITIYYIVFKYQEVKYASCDPEMGR